MSYYNQYGYPTSGATVNFEPKNGIIYHAGPGVPQRRVVVPPHPPPQNVIYPIPPTYPPKGVRRVPPSPYALNEAFIAPPGVSIAYNPATGQYSAVQAQTVVTSNGIPVSNPSAPVTMIQYQDDYQSQLQQQQQQQQLQQQQDQERQRQLQLQQQQEQERQRQQLQEQERQKQLQFQQQQQQQQDQERQRQLQLQQQQEQERQRQQQLHQQQVQQKEKEKLYQEQQKLARQKEELEKDKLQHQRLQEQQKQQLYQQQQKILQQQQEQQEQQRQQQLLQQQQHEQQRLQQQKEQERLRQEQLALQQREEKLKREKVEQEEQQYLMQQFSQTTINNNQSNDNSNSNQFYKPSKTLNQSQSYYHIPATTSSTTTTYTSTTSTTNTSNNQRAPSHSDIKSQMAKSQSAEHVPSQHHRTSPSSFTPTKFSSSSKENDELRARNRAKILQELVSTEEAYADAIENLILVYKYPLERDPSLHSSINVSSIFSNIESLFVVSKDLILKLKERLEMAPDLQCIGDIYIEKSKEMRLYVEYINNYENAMKEMDRFEHEHPKYLESLQRKNKYALDISSLLIMPVQRIPRYEMLLRELIKSTDEHHLDYNNLKAAYASIKDINVYINSKKKLRENRDRVFTISQELKGCPSTLLKSSRRWIREGVLKTECSNRKYHGTYTVYLFNDLIVLAKCSYGILRKTKKVEYVSEIDLTNSEFKEIAGNERQFRFISDPEGHSPTIFTFKAVNSKNKDMWISDLKLLQEERKINLSIK